MSVLQTLAAVGNGLTSNDGGGDALRTGAVKINTAWTAIAQAVNALAAAQTAGATSYQTKSDMDADLAKADGTVALVWNDSTASNNQSWIKSGAPGSGSWVKATDRLAQILGNGAGFQQGGTGSVVRPFQTKLREVSVSVTDYGAVGDGVTDDSPAFTAAFASGATRVIVPWTPSYYLVKNVVVPQGVELEGQGRKFVYSPTSVSDMEGSCCIVFNTSGTFCMAFAGLNSVKSLNFYGVNNTCSGFGPGSGTRLHFRDVSMIKFKSGFGQDTGYTPGAKLWNCHATQNTNGISNIVDSYVYGAQLNANTQYGVLGSAGANDTVYVGCKNEWNGSSNWHFFQCTSITIVGGVTDRAGAYGFDIRQSDVSISSVKVRRSGRSGSSGSGTAHFLLGTNTRVTLAGVTTDVGADDDGTGFTSPDYIFAGTDTSSGPVSAAGCDLTGSNLGISTGSKIDGVYAGNVGKLDSIRTIASSTGTVSGAGSMTLTASGKEVASPTSNSLDAYKYRVTVNYRNPSTGAVGSNEFIAIITRGGTNAAGKLYTPADASSTTVNLTGASVNVSISNVASAGTSFDIVATNTSGSSLQIAMSVRPA